MSVSNIPNTDKSFHVSCKCGWGRTMSPDKYIPVLKCPKCNSTKLKEKSFVECAHPKCAHKGQWKDMKSAAKIVQQIGDKVVDFMYFCPECGIKTSKLWKVMPQMENSDIKIEYEVIKVTNTQNPAVMVLCQYCSKLYFANKMVVDDNNEYCGCPECGQKANSIFDCAYCGSMCMSYSQDINDKWVPEFVTWAGDKLCSDCSGEWETEKAYCLGNGLEYNAKSKNKGSGSFKTQSNKATSLSQSDLLAMAKRVEKDINYDREKVESVSIPNCRLWRDRPNSSSNGFIPVDVIGGIVLQVICETKEDAIKFGRISLYGAKSEYNGIDGISVPDFNIRSNDFSSFKYVQGGGYL